MGLKVLPDLWARPALGERVAHWLEVLGAAAI
jgi:hypothetical protein